MIACPEGTTTVNSKLHEQKCTSGLKQGHRRGDLWVRAEHILWPQHWLRAAHGLFPFCSWDFRSPGCHPTGLPRVAVQSAAFWAPHETERNDAQHQDSEKCHPSHWRSPSFFRGVGQPPGSVRGNWFLDLADYYYFFFPGGGGRLLLLFFFSGVGGGLMIIIFFIPFLSFPGSPLI